MSKNSGKKAKVEEPIISTKEYALTLADLKKQIKEAQVKAVLSANKEMLRLYWSIGKTITEKQEKNGWGTSIIEKLAKDLQNEFPGTNGFSRANVFKMRAFYLAYEKVSQAVRQFDDLPFFNIPWGHNVILITKLKDDNKRLWYAQMAIERGWSRSALETWINSDLYNREGKAVNNFKNTLPEPQSSGAQQALKDPYVFGFLTLHDEHVEQELEKGLVDNVQKLLLELGHGFAFVGRQVHIEIGDKDYILDLLFYHFKLKCFVVVELKAREFDARCWPDQLLFVCS
jgi:predicted nuclease of restriction endonuclease-like (RecB) superfamily